MEKGISTIIATILLLIITISLVGVAYLFISGLLTSKMSKPISVLGASCNTSKYITLVISNDGTDPIEEDEVKIYIGSTYKGTFGKYIPPHESNVSSHIQGSSGPNDLLVISPSNDAKITVWC